MYNSSTKSIIRTYFQKILKEIFQFCFLKLDNSSFSFENTKINLRKCILVTKWKKVKVYLYMHHMYNYNTSHLSSENTRQVNMIKAVY